MAERTPDDKATLLQNSLIFQALDEKTKGELADMARLRRFTAGERIFSIGAAGDSMMAIAEGTVRIGIVTPAGRNVILAELHAGEVFGEIALLDGGERSADAQALTNCTLVVLDRRSLLAVIHRRPELALGLIELLCGRLRRSDERMLEIGFLPLAARLAKTLIRLTAGNPDGSSRPLARLSISQAEIGDMIGSSRENVNRCLRKWQSSEIVDLRDGWLVILDRSRLEGLASDD